MDYKIAIIGSKDSILGFSALGVETRPVASQEEVDTEIQAVHSSDEYAIMFITEDWADRARKTLEELPAKALPAVVAVPSQTGSSGAGLKNLSRIVEQAVGSDILKISE
jgi:V/A-type H+/Na+-transporting ATPase subunit F